MYTYILPLRLPGRRGADALSDLDNALYIQTQAEDYKHKTQTCIDKLDVLAYFSGQEPHVQPIFIHTPINRFTEEGRT